jgi:hypothetical protein
MKRPRRNPNLHEKTAACLLMLKRGNGEWLIPEPLRSKGSARDIVQAVEWHHENYYAEGGDTSPQMLTPLAPEDHRERTSKIDIPRIAKNKRIAKKCSEHADRMAMKAAGDSPKNPKKSRWPKRKFQTGKGFVSLS